MEMNALQKILHAAQHGNNVILNAPQVRELAMMVQNMGQDIGKLMFMSEYFEAKYLQYRDIFGPLEEDEDGATVTEGMITDVETGQENEEDGLDAQVAEGQEPSLEVLASENEGFGGTQPSGSDI